ncbi:MAG: DHHA1 domain-containing protein, partial [Flavisolibacter sp.]
LAQLRSLGNALAQKVQNINGVQFLGEVVEVSNADALKKLAFDLKHKLGPAIVVLTSAIEGKAAIVLSFDESVSIAKNLDASALVKQKIAPLIKGGGGGQKTLATAGGPDVSALQQVIDAGKSLL